MKHISSDLEKLILTIPKAELHLHIEGSFEPELMFAIADRNKIDLPYSDVSELRRAYQFSDLQDFLDIYYQGASVLQTAQDFYDLTYAYFRKASENNIVHAEIFFDPQTHTHRGITFETILEGITSAMNDASKDFGISSYLIMSFLRHLSEVEAFQTLEMAMPWQKSIKGVGLDSTELGNPPSKFQRVFNKAHEIGFELVAHAGEEGPAQYVRDAIELLNIKRIDHGNRALDDMALISHIVEHQIPLTLCPLSNLKLKVIDKMEKHPVKRFLNLGALATINSDDPAYFGGYLNDNYFATTKALNLDSADIKKLAKNSIQASFMDMEQKLYWSQQIDNHLIS